VEMEFGEMKRNTSNWSNFCMLLRRTGLTASAGFSCLYYVTLLMSKPVHSDMHRPVSSAAVVTMTDEYERF